MLPEDPEETMDELTARREQRRDEHEAWFLAEWDQLDRDEQQAIRDLVIGLRQAGLRHRPATVAWLRDHAPRR